MVINRSLRLKDNHYFHDTIKKKQIYLHHTVGGSAKSSIEYWDSSDRCVATAYVIERDGTIYEVFDPWYWAWHLGLKSADNTIRNKESVGIELASEGALKSGYQLNSVLKQQVFDEEWLYSFDIDIPPFKNAKKLYHILHDSDKFFDLIIPFRGYWYFDAYDDAQVRACHELVAHLCVQFSIPRILLPKDERFTFNPSYLEFNGIVTHCNVREDKTDLCPAWDWDALEQALATIEPDTNANFNGGQSGGAGTAKPY